MQNLKHFVEEGQRLFLVFQKQAPASLQAHQKLQDILGSCKMIATYDHLRSPFSNRLLTADLRYRTLIDSLPIDRKDAVVLLLDALSAPNDAPHGSHHGLSTGLGCFSSTLTTVDVLAERPSTYLHFQNSLHIDHIDERVIENKVVRAAHTILRDSTDLPRPIVARLVSRIADRAAQVHGVYRRCIQDKHMPPYSPSRLVQIRKRLMELAGLPSLGLRFVCLSEILPNLADVIILFHERVRPLWKLNARRFVRSGLFTILNSQGDKMGRLVPDADGGALYIERRPASSSCNGRFTIADLYEGMKTGRCIPSTALLYLLLHGVGGIAHYGNAYRLHEDAERAICQMLPRASITLDGANSVTIGSIRVNNRVLRNLTCDLLLFDQDAYRHFWTRACSTGQVQFNYNMAEWAYAQ